MINVHFLTDGVCLLPNGYLGGDGLMMMVGDGVRVVSHDR